MCNSHNISMKHSHLPLFLEGTVGTTHVFVMLPPQMVSASRTGLPCGGDRRRARARLCGGEGGTGIKELYEWRCVCDYSVLVSNGRLRTRPVLRAREALREGGSTLGIQAAA